MQKKEKNLSQAGEEERSLTETDPELGLIDAKARFLAATTNYDPLGLIRRNPLTSISCAFVAGAGLTWFKGKAAAAALLPSLVQVGSLLAKYGISRLK